MKSLRLVGIDLAGSPKRPTDLCIMNKSKHVDVGIVLEDSNLRWFYRNVARTGNAESHEAV